MKSNYINFEVNPYRLGIKPKFLPLIVVLTTLLAYANAGLIAAPAVATYSAAPAVSSSYIHQASPIAVAHAAPLAVAHAAPVAVAHAAPVVSTYASSPVAIHAPAYGATHQSVERSLGGAQSVSHYSKAVDSAFSSVRKYDTRITNDALSVAHAPVVSAYSAAPVYAKAVAPAVAYSAAPSFSSSYIQKAAPLAYASYAHAAPVATYAAHAAPVAAYAAHAAPVASYSAGPVVTKAAVAYSPAAVVSHMTFSGLGTAYQW
uniref:Cuticular protein 44-aa motif 1 n=1 Tax=Leptinotarsa decemlineata TaxID=7539 RepID=A0A3S7SJQ7_LEPDE|nr:cuticular protein 44-aa motif 1 [Leptinotarsa decemlineata]